MTDRLAEILAADGFQRRAARRRAIRPRRRSRSGSRAASRVRRSSSTATSTRSTCRSCRREIEDGLLTGSGASDMKGGIAAAVEALRALRDCGLPRGRLGPADCPRPARGPLGRRPPARPADPRRASAATPSSSRAALRRLPVAGRGSATWKVVIRREGPPVHEVMRPARRAERDRRRRRAGRAARPARRRARAATHPVCGAGERLHRPDPLRRDLQPVSRRRPGSRAPGAGCPGPTPTPSSASSATGSTGSPPTPEPTIDLRLDAHPRRLRARPGRPAGRGVSAMLPGDLRARPCPTAPSRSSTTATASGRWRASRRSPTAPAPAASTRSPSGSRSTTWSASRCFTRRPRVALLLDPQPERRRSYHDDRPTSDLARPDRPRPRPPRKRSSGRSSSATRWPSGRSSRWSWPGPTASITGTSQGKRYLDAHLGHLRRLGRPQQPPGDRGDPAAARRR